MAQSGSQAWAAASGFKGGVGGTSGLQLGLTLRLQLDLAAASVFKDGLVVMVCGLVVAVVVAVALALWTLHSGCFMDEVRAGVLQYIRGF